MGREQRRIRHRPDRARGALLVPAETEAGTGKTVARGARQVRQTSARTVWFAAGRGDRCGLIASHLRRPKGRPPSSLVIFCSSNSCLKRISPSRAFRPPRLSSVFSPSGGLASLARALAGSKERINAIVSASQR